MTKPNPKPFLRWAGSKRKLLPVLERYFSSDYNTYIEPFVGSAQLFFQLPVKNAILGDTNFGLINTYKNIQNNPQDIVDHLKGFSKDKDIYYKVRAEFDEKSGSSYNAALFLYLNTFCFNGLYRTNLQGKFNVPFAESSGKLIDDENLFRISEYLRKAEFIVGDFATVVTENCSSGDFVYLDPPYAVKNRRIFNQYGPQTFGLNDIERLKAVLKEIDKRNAKFVLSYAYCEESTEMSKGWNFDIVSTIRNISGFAQHRKVEKEIIITNIG